MSVDTQASLFGEEGMVPPRRSGAPDMDAIRNRLTQLIDTLRAAEREMPLSDRDLRMWQTVLPNMTKWLPENEAQPIRASFAKEVERLAATSRAGAFVAAPGG
jgi:hypothetical protein